ncbi:MAG: C1 family peptidase [Polyangiaceae bacterium]
MARSLVAVSVVLLTVSGCSSGSRNNARYAPPGYGGPRPYTYGIPNVAWGSTTPQPLGAPQPAYDRPVDVAALMRLAAAHVPCAPVEVAPGTWVRFECGLPSLDFNLPSFLPTTFTPFGLDTGRSLPPSVDLRAMGVDGPIKSQGAVGSCTAFSLSTTMDVAAKKLGRGDVLSPLHIWAHYGVPSMNTAKEKTANEPIALETTWPYDPAKACEMSTDATDSCGEAYGVRPASADADPTIQSERRVAEEQGRYKVVGLEALSRPFDSNQAASVLAGGDPIWMSASVNDEAWKSRNLVDGVIQDYSSTGDVGHAFVLVGYRAGGDGRQFLIHNSWSTKWGESGYAWINEGTLRRWGRAAYKVSVTEAGGGGVIPVPTPQTGGCASGQIKDRILGSCVNACADGSAPTAGVCGLPGGFPVPGGQPQPQPSGGCPEGQVNDPMTRQCVAACPSGAPPMGGVCLPSIPGWGR